MFLVQGICPPNPFTQSPGWLWGSGERIVNNAWLKKVQDKKIRLLVCQKLGFRGKEIDPSGWPLGDHREYSPKRIESPK